MKNKSGPNYQVSRYRPRLHQKWERVEPHNTRRAELYMDHGIVKVFSFPGDDRSRAFTSLEMYISPHVYSCSLGRSYHDRWLLRLAGEFDWLCHLMAQGETT